MAFQFGIAQPPNPNDKLSSVVTALGLTGNLKLCLDAGDAASYTSGQKWLDRSGGAYDFFLGADGTVSATDPTFTGTVGRQSKGEYWLFDGGDYFTYDTTNESWMNNIHKDSAMFTIAMWVYLPSSSSSWQLIGTNASNGGDVGFSITYAISVNGLLGFSATTGSATYGLSINIGDVRDRWTMIAFSLNEATGSAVINVNGTGYTGSRTYTSPSASAATYTMRIGGTGGVQIVPANTRFNSVLMWEGVALTASQLASLFQSTRSKFEV